MSWSLAKDHRSKLKDNVLNIWWRCYDQNFQSPRNNSSPPLIYVVIQYKF